VAKFHFEHSLMESGFCMATSAVEDRLLDLLVRWDELRQQGCDATAEELCADCPELAGDLGDRMKAMRGIDPVLDIEEAALFSTPGDSSSERAADCEVQDLMRALAVYRPQRHHARGGLGEVLAARQEELGRLVALKRIRPERLHEAARKRFLLEAVITAGLQHPGIVPVYGLGQDDNGPFYSMPLIEGQTLQEAIEKFHRDPFLGRNPGQRSLRFRELLQKLMTVCDTMAYAHDQGVIHRDLKPSNIMLGCYGETLVMDWGLAKRFGVDDWDGEQAVKVPSPRTMPEDLTATGAVLGTPQYMSPEQAKGLPTGPASDVFNLGLILYAILTGTPAFQSVSLGGADPLKVVRDAAVLPPRLRNRHVPRALDSICVKALASRPEDRYPSAKDISEEIRRWMGDEPVLAWREPLATRARRWVLRHRSFVTSVAATFISCFIGLGYFLYESQIRMTRQVARRLAEARGLVDALKVADVRAVPEIVRRLDPDIELVTDSLHAMSRSAGARTTANRYQTVAAIALLRVDPAQVEVLVDRLTSEETTPAELAVIREALERRANLEVVAPRVWTMLEGGPRARCEFVHLLAQVDTKPEKLVERLLSARDGDRNRATLVLALGSYPIDLFAPSERARVRESLLQLFSSAPDATLHSSLRWLLGQVWVLRKEISHIEARLAIQDRADAVSGRLPTRNWYVNGQMQTMAVMRGPVEFWMGSPDLEVGRRPSAEDRLLRRIERTFAIGINEVTRSHYQKFLDENPDVYRPDRPEVLVQFGKYMPESDCPVIGVDWYEAARYCNWLSLREGIPETEWCYPKYIDPKKPLTMKNNYLLMTGYRLPTEAEWEFACRAGAQTARPFGESAAWMASYAWFLENSQQRTHPVGSKKPNDFGLFDMLGNAIEWTFQIYDPSGECVVRDERGIMLDREIPTKVEGRIDCMLRGGSFYYDAPSLRSANRNWNHPGLRENTFGFRLARTVRIRDGKHVPSSGNPPYGFGKNLGKSQATERR
jgi:serine/threonine protein kinase/formylglycine-generating enzyme required for sulfatase activity